MTRRANLLPILLAGLVSVGCGDFFGSPPRVATDGYRASASVMIEQQVVATFEGAVRGASFRRELPSGSFPVYVLRGEEKRAFELDPATETVRDADPALAATFLSGHPLAPGFSESAMATQLGLSRFAREGDTVFAGNACHIWRFDDDPDADASSATWFWVAPALDRLVVQREREEVLADRSRRRTTTQFRNVRPGASEKLFEEPKGWRRVVRPGPERPTSPSP